MFSFPLLLTIYAGFTHAFEADHLLAVSNLVSQRNSVKLSLKDGIFWGLGHTSTLFFMGILIIVFKAGIADQYFHYFEALVGLMLVILGMYRLIKLFANKKIVLHAHVHLHEGANEQQHLHLKVKNQAHPHSVAYGVGLVHGLAGSGALLLIVLSQIKEPLSGLAYLIVFGAGSVLGMLLAAGIFSVPFSKRLAKLPAFQMVWVLISAVLCITYGSLVIYKNLLV